MGDDAEWESAAWKKELPGKYLADEEGVWDDEKFFPEDSSKDRDAFRKIYTRYFTQICQSNGFDIDIYPGYAKAAVYIPYLNFEEEANMLMELANHAIQDYNIRDSAVYKYELSSIEKVNFIDAEPREFFMTILARNLTLAKPLETFQIHAYKGPHGENVVSVCRKKT